MTANFYVNKINDSLKSELSFAELAGIYSFIALKLQEDPKLKSSLQSKLLQIERLMTSTQKPKKLAESVVELIPPNDF